MSNTEIIGEVDNISSHIDNNPTQLDLSSNIKLMNDINPDNIHTILRSDLNEKYDTDSNRIFNRHRGTLNIRIGPMFSGKTTWLNGELTQLADKRFSVLKIIHSDDIRPKIESCDNSGSTHNSSYRSLSNKITTIRASKLKDIDITKYHVIGVDESQFFPDLKEVIEDWVEYKGKHIRIAGLDGDSFKQKFGQTLDLIPICDEVIKLNASCKICLIDLEKSGFRGNILSIVGPFTKRLGHSKEQKKVGGAEEYIPVCRFHHSYVEFD